MAPDCHTFWRNPASGCESGSNARKSAAEFERLMGVILYELLTGSTPLDKALFKEAAWDEVKRLIREEEPRGPAHLSSDQSLPSLAASRQLRRPNSSEQFVATWTGS